MGSNGRNIENIDLRLSEILPVYLAGRLYLSAAVAGDKYCIIYYLVGFRDHRKLITIYRKFPMVSRGIWQTGPQNLEEFAAENCGP